MEITHVSEYNPFDMGPSAEQSPPEKPKPEVPATQAVPAQPAPTEPELHFAQASPSGPAMPPPSAPYPAGPAVPGRAPLAGQKAYGGPVVPKPPSTRPSMPPSMPPAYAAPQAAVPPAQPQPPSMGAVQYDLAGNPLPTQAPPPQSAPPPPSMGAVQYDLAGNPLPPQGPPPAPAAPYGYAPGNAPYAPPPSGYGGYQPAAASTSTAPATIPAGMEEAMTAGANWMIGIVLLTMASIWLNLLTFPIMMPYISYAAISGVVECTLVMGFLMHSYVTAAVLGSLSLIPLGLLGILGFRRQAWVFMIAMVIYGIDIPVTIITWILHFSIWGIILATAWHSFIFQRMFAAWTAAREINATMAGLRR